MRKFQRGTFTKCSPAQVIEFYIRVFLRIIPLLPRSLPPARNSYSYEKKREKLYIVLVKSDTFADTGLTYFPIVVYRAVPEMKFPRQQISSSLTSAKNSVMKSSGAPTLTDTSSATSSSSDWACKRIRTIIRNKTEQYSD